VRLQGFDVEKGWATRWAMFAFVPLSKLSQCFFSRSFCDSVLPVLEIEIVSSVVGLGMGLCYFYFFLFCFWDRLMFCYRVISCCTYDSRYFCSWISIINKEMRYKKKTIIYVSVKYYFSPRG
jgi:hypothetical protein